MAAMAANDGFPLDPNMPDLSHLSAEERAIIEQVLQRQRAEEQKEEEIAQIADKELEEIERQIAERKENAQRLVGTQDDAICQICQKTKFADGIGHKCFYCQLRSCARCGGKTTSKNKSIWACSMCQKRQQILARTGKWFQNASSAETQQQSGGACSTAGGEGSVEGPTPSASSHSFSATTSAPPQIQQEQQEERSPTQQNLEGAVADERTSTRRQSSFVKQPSIERSSSRRRSCNLNEAAALANGVAIDAGAASTNARQVLRNEKMPTGSRYSPPHNQQERRATQQGAPPHDVGGREYRDMDRDAARRRRNEDVQAHPSTSEHNYANGAAPRSERRPIYNNGEDFDAGRHGSGRSKGESGELSRRLRDKSDRSTRNAALPAAAVSTSATGVGYEPPPVLPPAEHGNSRGVMASQSHGGERHQRSPYARATGISNTVQKFSPSVARSSRRIKLPRQLRSLSSSEDEDVPDESLAHNVSAAPPPPSSRREKQQKNHRSTAQYQQQQQNLPSSSSLQNTSVQDSDFSEKASLSRFDVLPAQGGQSQRGEFALPRVRPIAAGNLLATKIRNYLSNPVSWQPSADQRRLIGHMILNRFGGGVDASEDFGLKLVGGRYSPAGGTLGTFIVQVKPSSVAATVGGLRPGDEVLEWNSHVMQNLSHEAVCKIVNSSRNNPKLELIVSRPAHMPGSDDFLNVGRSLGGPRVAGDALPSYIGVAYDTTSLNAPSYQSHQLPRIPYAQLPHSQSLVGASLHGQHFSTSLPPQLLGSTPPPGAFTRVLPFQQRHQSSAHQQTFYNGRATSPLVFHHNFGPAYLNTLSPMQNTTASGIQSQVCGKIEISLIYSSDARQLTITLHRAYDLTTRADGSPRNPYVKLFLLPDRSERSQRESSMIAGSLAPIWNETFVYEDLPEAVLVTRVLEITVWDYDKYEANAFLGETLIDLSDAALDGRPLIYALLDMDDDNPIRLRLRQRRCSSHTPPIRSRSHTGYYSGTGKATRVCRSLGAVTRGYNNERGYSADCSGSLQNLPFHPVPNVTDPSLRGASALAPACYNDCTVANGAADYEQDWNRNDTVTAAGAGYLSDYGSGDNGARHYTADDLRRLHRRPRSATALRNLSELENGAIYGNDSYGLTNGENDWRYDEPDQQCSYRQSHQKQHQRGRRELELIQQDQQAAGYGSDASDGTLSVNSAQSMQNRTNLRTHQQQYSQQQQQRYSQTLQQQQYIKQQQQQQYHSSDLVNSSYYYGDEESTDGPATRRACHNSAAAAAVGDEYGGGNTLLEDAPDQHNNNNGSCSDLLLSNNNNDNSPTTALAGSGVTGGMPYMASGKSATMLLAKRKKSLMTRFIPGRNGSTDGKRMGFARSEEIGVSEALSVPDQLSAAQGSIAGDVNAVNNITKQPSKESTDSSDNWLPVTTDKPLGNFVENLGPGQVVGRQCLASPILGEVQLGLSFDTTNGIVLDVLRARNLVSKPGAKSTPAPYVKAYLMDGKNCVAKAKTQTARKSSAPMIQQRLAFPTNPRGKMLQVSVLGDYGRMERKSFMGIAQISLNDIDLPTEQQQQIVGWYKLFHSNSIAGGSTMGPASSGAPSTTTVIRKDSENSMKFVTS